MARDAITCGLGVILHTYRTENWGEQGAIFADDSDEEEPGYLLDFRKANAAIKGAILYNGVDWVKPTSSTQDRGSIREIHTLLRRHSKAE